MKKYLLIIGFLLTSFVSFSQVIPKPNPTAVGIGYKRLLADSTIFIPTGGAIPRLGSNNINRRSAIYADTINKRLWVFYPNDSTWKVAGLTKITWDSVTNKPTYFLTKYDSSTDIKDSIQARLALRDTANMLSPYIKIVDVHGLPVGGTTGQILAKIDETDYNTQWIDNYTGDIRQYVKAGEAINKGQAVYVSSADGTNIIVSKASNASESTSSKTLGLLYQTLALNGQGFVITEGRLEGLNTLGATAGDPVWLGTNGNLIFGLANKPYAPAHLVYIGVVSRVNANNGEILVKIQNGFELKELHDVSAQSPSNNDGLFYNSSNSLWETKSIATALGYTPANAATYVPYTGATTDVDLGNHNLSANYNITSKNNISGRSVYVDGSVTNNEGSILGFKQYPSTFGGDFKVTALSALNNNSLGLTYWHDSLPTGQLRYKSISLRTDSLTINVGRTYYWPNASGKLALTSDIPSLSGYVPYIGATSSVNLGAFDISSRYIFSNGNGTASGLISMKIGNTITGVSGYGTIGAASGQQFVFNSFVSGSYSKTAYFNFSGLTDDVVRSYVFPDANGTIALTSDLGNYVTLNTFQTITANKSFSGWIKTDDGIFLSNSAAVSSSTGFGKLSYNKSGVVSTFRITNDNNATASLAFDNTANYSYNFPAVSGTVALTSDITSAINGSSGRVPLFTSANVIGNSQIYDNGTTVGVGSPVSSQNKLVSVLSTDLNTAYAIMGWGTGTNTGGIYSNVKSGNIFLGQGEVGGVSGERFTVANTGAVTSASSVKGTNFILSGGTGNTGLYYGHTDRVVLANYTTGGIDFETNGGNINMTLFPNGNLGVGTSLTDDGSNKLQVAGSGKFSGTIESRAATGNIRSYSTNAANDAIVFAGWTGETGIEMRHNPNSAISYIQTSYPATGSQQFGDIQFRINSAGTMTPVMTVKANNRSVGIGTTSPSNLLHLYKASGNTSLTLQTGSAYGYVFNDGTNVGLASDAGSTGLKFLVNRTAPDNAMTITSGGNLLVGTATDYGMKVVIRSGNTGENNAHLAFSHPDFGAFHFLDATAYWIGQNSQYKQLRIYSGANIYTGVYLAAGGSSWTAYSDERMKTDLMPIDNALNKVSQLRAVTGRYKTDEIGKSRSFLIAQDVQKVLPEAVTINNDEMKSLGVQYTDIIPLLVGAIKELKAEIEILKTQINKQ